MRQTTNVRPPGAALPGLAPAKRCRVRRCVVESVPDTADERATHRVVGPDGDPAAYVARAVSGLGADGVEVTTCVIADPIGPFEGLSDFLSDNSVVLIAVARHAREGLFRLLHRSLTAHLVDRGPCPVLALPLRHDS